MIHQIYISMPLGPWTTRPSEYKAASEVTPCGQDLSLGWLLPLALRGAAENSSRQDSWPKSDADFGLGDGSIVIGTGKPMISKTYTFFLVACWQLAAAYPALSQTWNPTSAPLERWFRIARSVKPLEFA